MDKKIHLEDKYISSYLSKRYFCRRNFEIKIKLPKSTSSCNFDIWNALSFNSKSFIKFIKYIVAISQPWIEVPLYKLRLIIFNYFYLIKYCGYKITGKLIMIKYFEEKKLHEETMRNKSSFLHIGKELVFIKLCYIVLHLLLFILLYYILALIYIFNT